MNRLAPYYCEAMPRRLIELDIAGEGDVSFSDFRHVDLIRDRLSQRHQLRVSWRSEPIGIFIDIPTALKLEAEYSRIAQQFEALQAAVNEAIDRADDEALARCALERISPDNPEPIVSGAEGADEFRRLYEEGIARQPRANSS